MSAPASQILVVDDSLTVRMGLADALAVAGYEPVPCATIAEARAALAARPIELAILDVRLPDGDGIDFLHELRRSEDRAALPILVLSTEAEVSHRVRGMLTGANDYVGKPYDPEFVLARVRQLVGAASSSRLVLTIDDSATFRNALAQRLADAHYEVATAASGTEGLRVAAARRPGAIIVDGVMPDMGGDLVVRRIRLDPVLRTTPCLLLTGSDDAVAEIHALDAGADAFARKDADIDVILARLAAMVRTASGPNEAARLIGPKRVLIVDADAEYLKALGGLLVDDAYDVVQATSGELAIELLSVQPVDCIVLGMHLPGLSGIETCKRIKAAPMLRDAALIALTADDTRSAMLGALAAGADDFVSKLAGNDVVTARVKAQIRRKKYADEHRAVRERLLQSEREAAEARAEAVLAEARAAYSDELAAANRELEAFSYSVSHDLRAPLRAIRSFTQMLEEDAGPTLDAASRDHLQRIVAASARMSDLIDALLELSRISRAGLTLSRVDLSAVAAAVIDELRQRDPARAVEVAVAPGLAADADPRLCRALLDNVIGNAWKFTADHPPGAARIEVGRERSAFFVRDNGAGFDMAHAGKLFAPFQRLHGGEFAGTGIGLATVRRIVERHKGRVWAESAVGAGTTIYFTLAG